MSRHEGRLVGLFQVHPAIVAAALLLPVAPARVSAQAPADGAQIAPQEPGTRSDDSARRRRRARDDLNLRLPRCARVRDKLGTGA